MPDTALPAIALPYFLSLPADEPPWPGVVVIHEGNGISPQLLRFCQGLAAAGYGAIAPDLFFRAGGTEAADFATLMGSLDPERTQGDIDEAAALLRTMGADKVGVTGFCMGGRLTYHSAVSGTGFDAAVGFYGAGIARELAEPRCPTLLFFGGSDDFIPTDEIEQVQAHHRDTVVYPHAGHGFFRDGSANYDEAAALDAGTRLMAFLAEHLRS
ncbi:MAG TPA: dienelactone hydrolase family protein [Acidimicrobiales bacterium]|nr:dienelactone hydrolase family protein [Acidimicrobiales bacterium]